jgi:LuxR family maltose regulon positive regulatory protein
VTALGLVGLGTANLRLGELATAGPLLREGLELAEAADLGQLQVSAGSHFACWLAATGRLRAAARTAHDSVDLAYRLGLMHMCDLGWAHLATAEAQYQWDRLDEAERLVEQALEGAGQDPLVLVVGTVMRARIQLASGRFAEAHAALRTARHEAACARAARAIQRLLSLVDAELRLASGDVAAARRRLSGCRDDEPFPGWAAAVEASILLAEGRPAAASAAVAPYLKAPADSDSLESESLTWRVRAGVLTALAGRELGDRQRVTRGLDAALEVAEAEGFRRPFAAAGNPLRELISAVAPAMVVYRPVVAELANPPDPAIAAHHAPSPGTVAGGPPAGAGNPADPLTERELTVLRYLQGTLSNVEIAALMYVSVNTLKTHVRSIYRKLHAGHRRDAVRRARDLMLL